MPTMAGHGMNIWSNLFSFTDYLAGRFPYNLNSTNYCEKEHAIRFQLNAISSSCELLKRIGRVDPPAALRPSIEPTRVHDQLPLSLIFGDRDIDPHDCLQIYGPIAGLVAPVAPQRQLIEGKADDLPRSAGDELIGG
jgi:hypothetical protein